MIGSRSLARKPHTPSSFPSVPFQSCRSCCYRLRSVLRRNVLCRVAANMLSRSVLQRTCCPAEHVVPQILPLVADAIAASCLRLGVRRIAASSHEPGPGADVAEVSPVPERVWAG
jgi:hypothetical protein